MKTIFLLVIVGALAVIALRNPDETTLNAIQRLASTGTDHIKAELGKPVEQYKAPNLSFTPKYAEPPKIPDTSFDIKRITPPNDALPQKYSDKEIPNLQGESENRMRQVAKVPEKEVATPSVKTVPTKESSAPVVNYNEIKNYYQSAIETLRSIK